MTNRQKIDTAREARLWIGQIVVPGLTLGASLMAIPEVRYAVAAKAREVKWNLDRKIEKLKRKEKG